ncbi:MAG: hypothetical protein ACR2N3_03415 [Pyrinomonadaceae bacterium]
MGKTNLEISKIQKLLARYLQSCSSTADSKSHLDEDSLSAFVEGRLSQPESSFILKHLTSCSFCLHIAAELAKFEYEFADEKIPVAVSPADKPEKISDVLNGLLSKFFGASDGAVFAHQEDAKEKAKKED